MAYRMSALGPDIELAAGTVIRDTYLIEGVLGSGAFAAVYRVRHRFLGTQAMKVFHAREGAPSVEDVLAEARILFTVVDPHVLRVFDANTLCDGPAQRPYLTMEFAAEGTLAAFLAETVRLHPISAVRTARQICAGLVAAHGATPPIVHCDVKPHNILIFSLSAHGTPQVKVGDFGLAKHVDPDSRMTRAAGTLHYMAPEAAWGFYTPASDVYSLGVVFFQMLTGVFPFPLPRDVDVSTLDGARAAILRSRRAAPPTPSKFCLDLASPIDDVVRKALAPEPGDRYRDAAAFGADIDRLIAEFG